MNKYKSFGDLRQSAAEAFVRTAILIDNEPIARVVKSAAPLVATSGAYGAEYGDVKAGPEAAEDLPEAGHQLPVLPVTNAFANRQITCGFYFPANDDDAVVQTALAAARHVDATIVDWQLRPKDTLPAKQLIAQLIKDDRVAGGRLRLIVVYTGERGIDQECSSLLDYLRSEGISELNSVDHGRGLQGKSILITFANKPRAIEGGLPELSGPGARPVAWADLPSFVLEQYAFLAKGLLQAFALKAIAAVRDDTHHLLSVFDSRLDGAFLAQRAGTGTPSDAEEMMAGLLTSEFACSIIDKGVATEILGPSGAVHALEVRDEPGRIKVKEYDPDSTYKKIVQVPAGGGKSIIADKTSLQHLIKVGLDSRFLKFKTSDERKSLDRQFFKSDDEARLVLADFARMASFVREVAGNRRLNLSSISLSGGIIVRSSVDRKNTKEQYLLCVQPGCDAVRLTAETAFPFCPLVPSESAFDIVLQMDGVNKYFKIDRSPSSLIMLRFKPNIKRGVVAATSRKKRMGFVPAEGAVFWEFVSELRPLENQHFTTLLVGKFNRVALNGSEWLRLHG